MPTVGEVLVDRYEIEGVLGAGGMASVYRAIDLRLQREVAVKVLLPGLASDPAVAARFEREARALAGAAHPGIVGVFDVESGDPETGREPFYVMELCDGGSLADRLEETGRLSPPDVVPTIAAIAEGLAAMHAQGLIHRDVKPHNILFCGDRPKLGDFGLARSERPAELTRLTQRGTTLGTLPYLAPELLGGAQPTTASDVYALGVTAYEALTGELPRPAGSLREMVEGRAAIPRLASTVEATLGSAFDEVLGAALAVEPGQRPSPLQFGAALTAAADVWTPAADAAEAAAKTAAIAIAAVPPPAQPVAATTETLVMPAAVEPAAPEPIVAAATPPAGAAPTANRAKRVALPRAPWRPDASTQRRLLGLAGAVVGIAAFVVVAASLDRMLGPSDVFDLPSPGVTASAAATLAATALPEATATPAASEADPALAAVDDVLAAIESARGGPDGLKGGEANDLVSLAERVRSALEGGDGETANEAAADLEDRAERASRDIDDERRARLLNAIDALREAIPEED